MALPHTLLPVVIFSFIAGLSSADKCPSSPPLTKNIDYDLIKGNWILAASNPEFDEKCKNLTFFEHSHGAYQLQEHLFMSTDNWKRKTNHYWIKKEKNSPIMILENKISHDKVKLFLVDGDYTTYIIFYSCDDSTGTVSEAWEIWSRGIKYESTNLPQSIINTLKKSNVQPSDFNYRTASDCSH